MKKVMVCVDLKDQSITPYQELFKEFNWDNIGEIYFVHGFQRQIYADNFYFTTYPKENEDEEIKKSANEFLKEISQDLVPEQLKSNLKTECLISNMPKHSLVEFAKEKDIDEMIIVTRGLHGVEGLFASSFAEYMVRHAHCQLRVLRTGY